MAIDPVREKHETWIKGALSVAMLVVLALGLYTDIQRHTPWEDIVQKNWIVPFMVIGLMPGRWAFLLQFPIITVVLWAGLHDKPLSLETLRNMPWVLWMMMALVIFYLGIFALIFLRRKVTASRPPEKLLDENAG